MKEILLKSIKVETFIHPNEYLVSRCEKCVRITHLESGKVFESLSKHTQLLNYKICLDKLDEYLNT